MRLSVKPVGMSGNILLLILAILAGLALIFCVLALTTQLFLPSGGSATLVLYQGPKPVKASETVSMKVDGHALFVYDTAVNNNHYSPPPYDPPLSTAPLTSFDFENGPVTMEITVHGQRELTDVVVRPLIKGITAEVQGNVIRFTISEPDVYTVEYGGDETTAMHIFANAIDHDAPTESSDTVMYIGPGAWNIGDMTLKDGQTLYISGGAVVWGSVDVKGVKNVRIAGHGFLDGSNYDGWQLPGSSAHVPVELENAENVQVSGIALLNSNAWCFNVYLCKNVQVDGVKIISARPNGDGFTFQSSQDITVTGSFVRSWDDSLVIKNYSDQPGTDSANITFRDCQIWTDLAQSMEIGYETNKAKKENATISNILFEDIVVLHNLHKPVMSIHNSDDCAVSNVTYRNIIVEDARMGLGDAGFDSYLIDINTIYSDNWSHTRDRGTVDGVTFDGIYVLGGDDLADKREGNFCPVRVYGDNKDAMCRNVSIGNLFVLGKWMNNETAFENPSTIFGSKTENVAFTGDGVLPPEIAAISGGN